MLSARPHQLKLAGALRAGWHSVRELINELEQHFKERDEFFCVGLLHHNNFVRCLVSLFSNVVYPPLAVWWNVAAFGKVLNIEAPAATQIPPVMATSNSPS